MMHFCSLSIFEEIIKTRVISELNIKELELILIDIYGQNADNQIL